MTEQSAEERLIQSAAKIPDIPGDPDKPLSKKPRRIKPFLSIFLVVVFLVVGLLLGATVLAVYTSVSVPFIGEKQEQALNKLLYRVPLLPKTPRQVLIAAADANADLTAYTSDFSLNGTLGSNAITLGSFDLAVAGPIDLTPGTSPKMDLAVDAGVSFGGEQYSVGGQLKKDGETMYVKVDELSKNIFDMYGSILGGSVSGGVEEEARMTEIYTNLNEVLANWLMYDMSGMDTEARKLMQEGENEALVDTAREKAMEILFERSVLPEIQKMPDEIVDDVATYHLQFAPSNSTLSTIIKEYDSLQDAPRNLSDEEIEDAVDAVEKLQVDMYFGKKDTVLRKASVQVVVSLDTLSEYGSRNTIPGDTMGMGQAFAQQLVDMKLTTSMVMYVRDIGKSVVIVPPESALSVEEYGEKLQDAFMTQEMREEQAKQDQYEDDFKAIARAMTRYFVANQTHPSYLGDLLGEYLPTYEPAAKRLNTYTYQSSADGQKYILYVEHISPDFTSSYRSSPFYGITNTSSYPHYLTSTDISTVY